MLADLSMWLCGFALDTLWYVNMVYKVLRMTCGYRVFVCYALDDMWFIRINKDQVFMLADLSM